MYLKTIRIVLLLDCDILGLALHSGFEVFPGKYGIKINKTRYNDGMMNDFQEEVLPSMFNLENSKWKKEEKEFAVNSWRKFRKKNYTVWYPFNGLDVFHAYWLRNDFGYYENHSVVREYYMVGIHKTLS